MKIVVSAGFPYSITHNLPLEDIKGNVHAEQQGDDLFVSKDIIKAFREYFLKQDIARFERLVVLHRDHTALYSSSDPEIKK